MDKKEFPKKFLVQFDKSSGIKGWVSRGNFITKVQQPITHNPKDHLEMTTYPKVQNHQMA